MASPRTVQRIASWIHKKVATMFIRDFNDPRMGLLTVTRVEVSNDLENVTVFYSVMSGDLQKDAARENQTEHVLRRAAPYVQKAVASGLRTRVAPKIHFEFDETVKGALAMNQLLEKLARERAAREAAEHPNKDRDDVEPSDE